MGLVQGLELRNSADTQEVSSSETGYLAICRHDEAAFYLFHCNDLWQVIADTWHETLEAAMRQAEFEYRGVRAWQAV